MSEANNYLWRMARHAPRAAATPHGLSCLIPISPRGIHRHRMRTVNCGTLSRISPNEVSSRTPPIAIPISGSAARNCRTVTRWTAIVVRQKAPPASGGVRLFSRWPPGRPPERDLSRLEATPRARAVTYIDAPELGKKRPRCRTPSRRSRRHPHGDRSGDTRQISNWTGTAIRRTPRIHCSNHRIGMHGLPQRISAIGRTAGGRNCRSLTDAARDCAAVSMPSAAGSWRITAGARRFAPRHCAPAPEM